MKQSHEERCRKYKQQIENLKLDNIELQEQINSLQAKLTKYLNKDIK
jgi:cell division protein FtsB